MKTTPTRFRSRSHQTAIVAFIAVFGLVACGSDKKTGPGSQPSTVTSESATSTSQTTEAPTTTQTPATTQGADTSVVPTTTAPVPADQEAGIFVDPNEPTCVFRIGELVVDLAKTTTLDSIKEIIGPFLDVGRVGNPDTLGANLHLLRIGLNPLDAAAELAKNDIQAAPNYIFAFAPGWRYGPYDVPKAVTGTAPTPVVWNDAPTIAVLDTGWTDLNTMQAAVRPPHVIPKSLTPPPGALGSTTQTEVTKGLDAGHGTFITNELGQLLPNATYIVAGIDLRYQDDNAYAPATGPTPVSIRDDSTVTSALSQIVDPTVEYLNISFGSYGCTALHKPNPGVTPFGSDDIMEPYYIPLGLRTVMTKFDGTGLQVFAASGNDSYAPPMPEIFYPAGLAPNYRWLHSVASDPKDVAGVSPPAANPVDYSNRGPWVETQARGSRVASQLPDTAANPEGWYEWSGTSFATPCALALYAHNSASTTAGTTPTKDLGDDPAGPYLDCAVNIAPGSP